MEYQIKKNTTNTTNIYIFTTKFGYYIANVLQYLYHKNSINAEIVYEIDINKPNLYIILFSQKVKQFPRNYIIYQLEQKDISNWIDKKYEASILFSKKTFDYSVSNIKKFDNLLQKKMEFYPIPLIPIEYLLNINYNIPQTTDILFYGSMNNSRKQKISYIYHKLYKKYSFKIINNIYGKDLVDEIIKSKIVLNIHFYNDAILETCRINEIISCKKLVISEKPNIIDENNFNMYKDKVVFIDNINDMYNKIIYYLENPNEYNKITENIFQNHNICDIINNFKIFL